MHDTCFKASKAFILALLGSGLTLGACSDPPPAGKSNDEPSTGGTSSTPQPGSGGEGGDTTTPSGGTTSGGTFAWPESKKAAVSLTYDDGLDSHLVVVGPQLESHGLRGTFFISNFPGATWSLPHPGSDLNERQQAWAALIGAGHEAAGHTVNHPCPQSANNSGPEFWLESYDEARMAAELDDSTERLERYTDEPVRSFAYPCGSDEQGIGPEGNDYAHLVAERYLTARVSEVGIADPHSVDLHRVPHRDALGKSGAELRAWVDEAITRGGWLVLLFHGVGEDVLPVGSCTLEYAPEDCVIHYLDTSSDAHEELLQYLASKQDEVWTAPQGVVAEHIAQAR